MKSKTVSTDSKLFTSWTTIKWNCVYETVKRLRMKIFQATKERDIANLKRYQQLMLRSKANLLLSIRKVTKVKESIINKNSIRYPNKLDEFKWNLYLNLKELKEKDWINILKCNDPHRSISNTKFNSTGLNIVTNKVLQSMVRNALEPEWKFKFENSSYGFRPNKSQANALEQLKNNISKSKTNSWVLQVNLTTHLNLLSNEILLSKLAQFPAKKVIYHWLKSRNCTFLEDNLERPEDVLKNKIISPLLTNITLHGVENILDFVKVSIKDYAREKNRFSYVLYSNGITIVTESKHQCKTVQEKLEFFLNEIGLKFIPESIKIFPLEQEITLLGCKLKTNHNLNKKFIITPHPDSISYLKEKLNKIWDTNKTKPPEVIIPHLNRLVKSWATFYKSWQSSQAFWHLDFWMHHKTWRYALRKHPNKGKKWIKNKYFPNIPNTKSNWSFLAYRTNNTVTQLLKFRYFKKSLFSLPKKNVS